MSLAISASFESEHYIAVDSAISFVVNGISYRNTEQQMFDKLKVLDGEAYFFLEIEISVSIHIKYLKIKQIEALILF